MPTLYLITPTYCRGEQKAELTRISQTLMHIPNINWIVVEDSFQKTKLVTEFLSKSGLTYTHLYATSCKTSNVMYRTGPKGVVQRNAALTWIRKLLHPQRDAGVVYFLDDDNTYSLEIFTEVKLP